MKLDKILFYNIFNIKLEIQLLTVLIQDHSKSVIISFFAVVQYGCNTAHGKYGFSLNRLLTVGPKYFNESLYSTLHFCSRRRNEIWSLCGEIRHCIYTNPNFRLEVATSGEYQHFFLCWWSLGPKISSRAHR